MIDRKNQPDQDQDRLSDNELQTRTVADESDMEQDQDLEDDEDLDDEDFEDEEDLDEEEEVK